MAPWKCTPQPAVLWRTGHFGSDSEGGGFAARRLMTGTRNDSEDGRYLTAWWRRAKLSPKVPQRHHSMTAS
jgi:hypothetical protein